ncbi:MAG: glycosyltransferase family 2 protein [Mastigocoleus sp.]
MNKLVSIIMPCFNAQRWLQEAIDSCLTQTYPHIEIVVVDDGSTDDSLEIIKNYGDKITWKSLPENCGGSHARNQAIALSKGEYIQFLDADDFIFPEKIARQVSYLEETGADIVYGDWQHKFHLPDAMSYFGEVRVPGKQTDILESLLANWWSAIASLLYRRSIVEKSDSWDEGLIAAQDRDYFINAVINGAKVVYQPGCYSVYRSYGNVTVSTLSKPNWVKSHCYILKKAEQKLISCHIISKKYKQALALCYFQMARESLLFDYYQYRNLLKEVLIQFPEFKMNSKSVIYNFMQTYLGFYQTELIASSIILLNRFFSGYLRLLRDYCSSINHAFITFTKKNISAMI